MSNEPTRQLDMFQLPQEALDNLSCLLTNMEAIASPYLGTLGARDSFPETTLRKLQPLIRQWRGIITELARNYGQLVVAHDKNLQAFEGRMSAVMEHYQYPTNPEIRTQDYAGSFRQLGRVVKETIDRLG